MQTILMFKTTAKLLLEMMRRQKEISLMMKNLKSLPNFKKKNV
jgi:hypothetical protein